MHTFQYVGLFGTASEDQDQTRLPTWVKVIRYLPQSTHIQQGHTILQTVNCIAGKIYWTFTCGFDDKDHVPQQFTQNCGCCLFHKFSKTKWQTIEMYCVPYVLPLNFEGILNWKYIHELHVVSNFQNMLRPDMLHPNNLFN